MSSRPPTPPLKPPAASSHRAPPQRGLLPPTYLTHLRALLRQFLESQLSPDTGVPNRGNDPVPLWSDDRLRALERALWEGAILPAAKAAREGKGLLDLDWEELALKSKARKDAWAASQRAASPANESPVRPKTPAKKGSGSEKDKGKYTTATAASDTEATSRGRKSTLGFGSSSASSTPAQSTSRPPSVASSDRKGKTKVFAVEFPDTPSRVGGVGAPEDEWRSTIMDLAGYRRLVLPKRDEWDIVDDDLSRNDTLPRHVPGAFPQSEQYDRSDSPLPPRRTASRARFDTPPPPDESIAVPPFDLASVEMLKPLFCAHFAPASRHRGSASTLRLARSASSGAESSGSQGSGSTGGGNGWWGSGARWSDFTATQSSTSAGSLSAEWKPGQYALPEVDTRRRTRSRSGTPRAKEKRDDEESDESGEGEEAEDSDEEGTAWGGTQRGAGGMQDKGESYILSGEVDDIPPEAAAEDKVGLVGGTLVIRGMQDDDEQEALVEVLKAFLYTIQSMILELALLETFGVPREQDPPPPVPKIDRHKTLPRPPSPEDGSDLRRSQSHRLRGERTKSFFSRLGKDTSRVFDSILGKRRPSGGAAGMAPSELESTPPPRRFSSDLPGTPASYDDSPRPPSGLGLTPPTHPHQHPVERHLGTLRKLEEMQVSTTPNLRIPMPKILLRVLEEDRVRREKAREEIREERRGSTAAVEGLPTRTEDRETLRGRALGYRLGGDVRSGLGALASGIDSFEGWQRLQRLDVLYMEGVEDSVADSEGGKAQTTLCQKPSQKTMVFYSPSTDMSLAEYLEELGEEVGDGTIVEGCERSGCGLGPEGHWRAWAHGGKKVLGKLDRREQKAKTPVLGEGGEVLGLEPTDRDENGGAGMEVWVKCEQCGKESKRATLEGVGGMYSWGKFLELILYSDVLSPLSCDHPNSTIYNLQTPLYTLHLTVEDIEVLDARLPKLQVGPNVSKRKAGKAAAEGAIDGITGKDEREVKAAKLREEIKVWAEGANLKIEAVEARMLPFPVVSKEAAETPTDKAEGAEVQASTVTLRDGLESSKTTLLNSLATGPSGRLNDFRHYFSDTILAFDADLEEWIKNNKDRLTPLPGTSGKDSSSVSSSPKEKDSAKFEDETLKPEHERRGVHALPGSSVLIREDEPCSVIAYTLSCVRLNFPSPAALTRRSLAYFTELGSTKSSHMSHTPEEPKSSDESARPAASTADLWRIEVRRKDTPRDLLSLRTIAKRRSDLNLPATGKLPVSLTPNGPSLELNLEQAEGKAQSGENLEQLVATIRSATKGEPILSGAAGTPRPKTSRTPSVSDVEGSLSDIGLRREVSNTSRDEPMSDSGLESSGMIHTRFGSPRFANLGIGPKTMGRHNSDTPPPPSSYKGRSISLASPNPSILARAGGFSTPPGTLRSSATSTPRDATSTPTKGAGDGLMGPPPAPTTPSGTWTSSVTSSFTALLKLSGDVSDSIASRLKPSSNPDTPRSLASIIAAPLSTLSGLASTDNALTATDFLPHIHLTYTLADRFRWSCTVYFASSFDVLRRRCAVEKGFVASLEKTRVWKMQGGKSGAGWWMTQDGRFVIKELVSKWNVSDTQALLEIAPSYFEHLAGTHNRATALAKIVGFYTVKSHDLQTNAKTSMDLLVMENLFYKQKVSKTFDLKGIETRRVPKGTPGNTLFDGEWLDAQTRDPLLLHPHAKRILLDSLAFDTRYLTTSGIMDYSLLLGLDNEKKELVVGLVDAVGSFGLWKRLESAGKVQLRGKGREGEVTVIPPEQYRERFEHAMRTYFLACPDKWSKSSRKSSGPAAHEVGLPTIF